MRARLAGPTPLAAMLAAQLFATVAGCATDGNARGSASQSADAARPESRPRPAASSEGTALVAMVDGEAVAFSDVRSGLVELGGQQALRDAIVDRRLQARLAREGLTVGAAEIEREERLLLGTLSEDPGRARELLAAIRARQGLGERRFAALLARNAALRALVARAVVVDEEGVRNAYDMLHGPKRVARMAVLPSLEDAERFRADLAGGRDFAELAVERSLDDGAARGGLLPPIARRDPSYPEALRAAIFATAPGTTSPPVLDGPRFYLVAVVREQPGDGTPPEAARARCEDVVRLSRERLLMDALARELASLEGTTIFDRSFDPLPQGGSGPARR